MLLYYFVSISFRRYILVRRRIKDRWHNSTPEIVERRVIGEKNLLDHASALAYIIWRQALNGAIDLHDEDFRYDDDHERIAVITEMLAFQIQHTDRLSHSFLSDKERGELISELCAKVADQVQDNLTDIAGAGNYRPPFVQALNERFSQYANFGYNGNEPSFECVRFFGSTVLDVLGDDNTNRWVIDQIIAIAAPDLAGQITQSVNRLFGRDA